MKSYYQNGQKILDFGRIKVKIIHNPDTSEKTGEIEIESANYENYGRSVGLREYILNQSKKEGIKWLYIRVLEPLLDFRILLEDFIRESEPRKTKSSVGLEDYTMLYLNLTEYIQKII